MQLFHISNLKLTRNVSNIFATRLTGKMVHYKKHLKQQFQNILDVVEMPFDGENPIQTAEMGKKLHAKTNPELLRNAKI